MMNDEAPKPLFKMMKVFECYSMPKEVKKCFFRLTEGASNHCYVSWTVDFISEEDPDDYDEEILKCYAVVDGWFCENGADAGEDIIISHSW